MMNFLRAIPMMKAIDMAQSLDFYTRILDFEIEGRWPLEGLPSFANLNRGNVYIQLSTHSGDGAVGSVATIVVDGIDALFDKYLTRGLDTRGRQNSPVHRGPVDQTWGWREFYATDPAGNTLRFSQKL